jgi:hypothetical protein
MTTARTEFCFALATKPILMTRQQPMTNDKTNWVVANVLVEGLDATLRPAGADPTLYVRIDDSPSLHRLLKAAITTPAQ